MKKLIKKIKISKKLYSLLAVLVIFCTAVIVAVGVSSKDKPYYSGDVVVYNDQVVIGSVNSGKLEIFKLENKKLIRESSIRSFDAQYSNGNGFYNFIFSEDGGKLYAYVVDGKYLYIYDVSTLDKPSLIAKNNDSSWDYFVGVKKVNGKIYTLGTRGVKVWDKNLQVIDSYNVTNNNNPYSISFNEKGNLIFNIVDKKLQIFDTQSRKVVTEISLVINENHNRKIFYQNNDGKIFVVDDANLYRLNYGGGIEKTFKHVSTQGFDVAGINGQSDIYFSDGVGVVKVDAETLKPVVWRWYREMGVNGGWSMGLNVVKDSGGNKVIVFNANDIVIMDGNLHYIDSINSTDENLQPIEQLSLSLDKHVEFPGTQVILRGTGFAVGEDLMIDFSNTKTPAKADENGRFVKILTVPASLPMMTQIKVTGLVSKLTYSTSFKID